MSGFYAGERTDGDRIELAIAVLEGQGHVEIEDDEQMDALVVELQAVQEAHRDCIVDCQDPYARDAEQLAHCWMQERMLAWERQAPRFECACGVEYGLENDGWRGHAFYRLAGDGTFDGQVEECPCGRELARLRAGRGEREQTGEQVLFE